MDVRVFAYPTAPTDGRWILWQARSYSRSRWPRTCPTGPGSPSKPRPESGLGATGEPPDPLDGRHLRGQRDGGWGPAHGSAHHREQLALRHARGCLARSAGLRFRPPGCPHVTAASACAGCPILHWLGWNGLQGRVRLRRLRVAIVASCLAAQAYLQHLLASPIAL